MNTALVIGLSMALLGVGDPKKNTRKKDNAAAAAQETAPAWQAGPNGAGPDPRIMQAYMRHNSQNVQRLNAAGMVPAPPPGGLRPAQPLPAAGGFRPPQVGPGGFRGPVADDAHRADLPKNLIPALIEALKDQDRAVRQYAAAALVHLGKEAVGPLLDVLKGKDKAQRANAAYVLGQIGSAAQEEALPTLLKALKDDDRQVRVRAAFAVERLVAGAQQGGPFMAVGMMRGMGGRFGGEGERSTVTLPADPGTVPPGAAENKAAPKDEPKKSEKRVDTRGVDRKADQGKK